MVMNVVERVNGANYWGKSGAVGREPIRSLPWTEKTEKLAKNLGLSCP
jgi:hypothetical protein